MNEIKITIAKRWMRIIGLTFIICHLSVGVAQARQWTAAEVKDIVYRVNNTWQQSHGQERSFWDPAVYHTGNMEAFFTFGNLAWLNYSR